MSRTKGLNKYQKTVYKVGERRAGREQIAELLEKANSTDAEERCEAAENLCPCHVRKRIDAVWDALYKMLEDPDVKVRRAAWHTLEDGGTPDDPALDEIVERARKNETDRQVQNLMRQVMGPRQEREMQRIRALGRPLVRTKGKCDFCAASNVFVDRDGDTQIRDDTGYRYAWICDSCRKTI
jgi:hypothetical protein